jgi:hypothetical protein
MRINEFSRAFRKKYLTSSVIIVYIQISHEGDAPMKGAAISGFFY